MRADNTAHLAAAGRRRTELTRRRAVTAIRRMDTAGTPVNFDTVARHARVSRSWLYTQPDLRTEIERLRARHRPATAQAAVPDRQRATNTSLLTRLEAASDRIRQLEADNRQLRDALARALGHRRTTDILGQPASRDTPSRQPARTIGPC